MTRKIDLETVLWAVLLTSGAAVFGLSEIQAPQWTINLSFFVGIAAMVPAIFLYLRRMSR